MKDMLYIVLVHMIFFQCLDHDPTDPNEHRWQQLRHSMEFMSKDGLNSLNYSVNKIIHQSQYTHVFANI